jgi:hypothetical protein
MIYAAGHHMSEIAIERQTFERDGDCGGVISSTVDGTFIERFACEEHLFDEGICKWQQAVYDERKARRYPTTPRETTT